MSQGRLGSGRPQRLCEPFAIWKYRMIGLGNFAYVLKEFLKEVGYLKTLLRGLGDPKLHMGLLDPG